MGNMMNGEEINVSNRKLKTKGYERLKDFCVSGLQKVVINKASCASDWEIAYRGHTIIPRQVNSRTETSEEQAQVKRKQTNKEANKKAGEKLHNWCSKILNGLIS